MTNSPPRLLNARSGLRFKGRLALAWASAAGCVMGLSMIFAAPSLAQTEPSKIWTLPLLIRYALENNKGLAASQLAVQVFREDKIIATSQWLPHVDAVGKYQLFPEHRRLLIPRHGRREHNPFRRNILNYGLEATMPIYTGGRIRQQAAIADASVAVSQSQAELTRQELIFNVMRAFYSHLRIREVIAANEALVRSVNESRRVIREQVNIGRAARIEFLRLDARSSSAETQLAIATSASLKTAATLKALLGLPQQTRFAVAGQLEATGPAMDFEIARITAISLRPDIIALESEIEAQKSRIKIARARGGPTADAALSFGGVSGESETEVEGRLMLSLRLPLYAGGALKARQRQAVSRLSALKARFAATKRNALAEVELAHIELSTVAARLETAARAVTLAGETLRIDQQRFREGRGTSNELLQSEEAVLRAKTNLAAIMADGQIAAAALKLATGDLDVPNN